MKEAKTIGVVQAIEASIVIGLFLLVILGSCYIIVDEYKRYKEKKK